MGLFKGMASPLLGLAAINTIVFGVQGNIMRQYDRPTTMTFLMSGAAAGSVQSIVSAPMELAKIRMQMEGIGGKQVGQKARYSGSVDAIKKIYRREGLRGCYRGYTLTLLRDTPGFAVYFAMYDFLCRRFAKMSSNGEIGIGALLLAGGLSGMSSWIMSFAPDVMKTRIQVDGTNGVNKYNGIMDVCRKSYRDEGAKVFTRGLGATLLRAFPVNAATFTVVTLTLQMLDRQAEERNMVVAASMATEAATMATDASSAKTQDKS